jgi:hypothetical protein
MGAHHGGGIAGGARGKERDDRAQYVDARDKPGHDELGFPDSCQASRLGATIGENKIESHCARERVSG